MRKPTKKAKRDSEGLQASLNYQELQKENLRLHRIIAKLEAQAISSRNRNTAVYEDTTSGVSEQILDEARKLAKEQ